MPKLGEMTQNTKQEIEPGQYAMTFERFTEPELSQYTTKNGGAKMQVNAVYRFADTGDEYLERYITVSSYDGAGGEYPASKMFLRLRGLVGCKDKAAADELRLEDIKSIPVMVMFAENSKGHVRIAQVMRDKTARSKPA